MVAGSLRFLSFLVSCATARLPMTQWQRQRFSLSVPWLNALSKTSRVPSRSTSPFPSPHESLAARQGQAFVGGSNWHWVETQTIVRVTPDTVTRRMARRCLRFSRRRGNWSPNARACRKAHWHYSPRPLAPSVSSDTPDPSFQGNCPISRVQPAELGRSAHACCVERLLRCPSA